MPGNIERISESLTRHRDFMRLWSAQAVSSIGARVAREGLPLTAVLVLHAPPVALGLLAAARAAPSMIVGILGGTLVDRIRRRPVLIAADLGRAAVLLVVPWAAFNHRLNIAEVFFAAAVIGGLNDLYDIADHAYLPTLVERDLILAANARLSASESAAEIGGPALAGALVSLLTAPIALLANIVTYLASATLLAGIRHREPRPSGAKARISPAGLMAGFAIAWRTPAVRPLMLSEFTSSLFGGGFSALYVIFAIDALKLTPAMLGITVAVGGAGSLIGAALAGPAIRRIGIGPALIVSWGASAAAAMLIPLAAGGPRTAMVMLMAAQLIGDSFGTAALIYAKSVRQSLLPVEVLGRVGGAFTSGAGLATVAGALVGGELGGAIGMRPTLIVVAAGMLLALVPLLLSPLPRLRRL